MILLGFISFVHGIKGHVAVRSLTYPITNILQYNLLDANHKSIKLRHIFTNAKNMLICAINNINNRSSAEALVGVQIFCYKKDLPPILEQNEFYIEHLRHLNVIDKNGVIIGRVKDVMNFGAGDLIEVVFENKCTTILPFTQKIFPTIADDYIVMINDEE